MINKNWSVEDMQQFILIYVPYSLIFMGGSQSYVTWDNITDFHF